MNWTIFFLGLWIGYYLCGFLDWACKKRIAQARRKFYRIENREGCFYVYMFGHDDWEFATWEGYGKAVKWAEHRLDGEGSR